MIQIYLASRYGRRDELIKYRNDLIDMGFHITSRWLMGDPGVEESATVADKHRWAKEDWEDLQEASIFLTFTEPPESTASRGGRHVEFGAALGFEKRCMVVGPRENVFHCLPQVEVFETWEKCVALLKRTWPTGRA